MDKEKRLLQCYNRGCTQKFDPTANHDKACCHHPGVPVFHDAYKGWSCCNKKCIDFTEFLNIKGCTVSEHSNIEPIQPEKPVSKDVPHTEVLEIKPIVRTKMIRPSFDSPLVAVTPEIAPSLKQLLEIDLNNLQITEQKDDSDVIPVGTLCKNGGCNVSYEGPQTDSSLCVYHPGSPIFHEGMKFWSCCQKRTSDFNTFLNQPGCQQAQHMWKKTDSDKQALKCRWDWHQTGSFTVISIYAKQYCPKTSTIQLNSIRVCVKLIFPQQVDAVFKIDIELYGQVDVSKSQVTMYGTKLEIKLKKAEPGTWPKLEIVKPTNEKTEGNNQKEEDLASQVDSVDLTEL